jgi:hypothetical protein
MCIFLEEFDPVRQLIWRAEWGRVMRKRLSFALFWHSANGFPWRNGGRLPIYNACVCKTRKRNAIYFRFCSCSFPCVRAGGKDTFAKSQLLVIYDVKRKKYFANRVAKLAKWQRTRSREIVSLHRFISLHAFHFIARISLQ